MKPVFILSYPRSRTAWLSCYLTGAGVPCIHEAWKSVESIEGLRTMMELRGNGVVVNSDCSNVFFLPELQTQFPGAIYVKIANDTDSVVSSLKRSYGDHDYSEMLECYEQAFQHPCRIDATVDWSEQSVRDLWKLVGAGRPFDEHWFTQMDGVLVQLMPWQIEADIASCRQHEQDHIVRAMARWRATWV